jgi:hypothetical protein
MQSQSALLVIDKESGAVFHFAVDLPNVLPKDSDTQKLHCTKKQNDCHE